MAPRVCQEIPRTVWFARDDAILTAKNEPSRMRKFFVKDSRPDANA